MQRASEKEPSRPKTRTSDPQKTQTPPPPPEIGSLEGLMERGVLQWPIALARGLLRPLHPPRLVQAPYLKEQFRVLFFFEGLFPQQEPRV